MDESKTPDSASQPRPSKATFTKQKSSWPFTFLVTVLVPVVAATLLYQLDSFDPAPLPPDELTRHVITVPARNDHMLRLSEFVGVGNLKAPEDVAYDAKSGVIYTGCADGWISRVTLNDSAADSVVEKWVNTGGRPLGIAFGHNNELIVADPEKGLLNVTADGLVELLTDEADGQKFKTTDAVDVAHNGIIYFTDASYKYGLSKFIWDILEGKPHGRLLSYDPATKTTKVLVRDLYFANGVVVTPDQNYVIFCETPVRRCRKYHIQGEEKGRVEKFIDYLPGMPDNIRYDGDGQYWIGLATSRTLQWDIAFRYPFIRKILLIMEKYIGRPPMEKNSGIVAIDLAGNPMAHYYDPGLALVTSGMKIGNHLYIGSICYPYILRLNLKQYSAEAAT
ncbi:protein STRICTOSIDINE SYNTHASE-LIKE 5-like isoform X6 [Quercus robur]|uniref:protein STRICTOSIDINE SYNTHASE-LIKE 5-like isoform X6 n=1 Tax=Quercus robur TaxID=38942 RepID=UPI0021627A9D|nr:protein STRICTOSIDINE SYNTHASE-LIKE 5-like isoform X6 [Quercus robur]